MSQFAAEKDEEINTLHHAYMDAFEALMLYQDRHPPAHRTPKETEEVSRLTSICGHAKYLYETAEMRRHTV